MLVRRIGVAFASVVTVCALFALSGCASPFSLPTSGDVKSLPKGMQRTQRVFTSPNGPEDGAQPDSIVRGFLAALPAGPQSDGFAVARQFLTQSTAASWNPYRQVLIYASDPVVERKAQVMTNGQIGSSSQATVAVSITLVGQLDAHGVYSASLSSSAQQLEFRLVQVNGQWRIYDLPGGIAILESDFAMAFKQVTLYQVASNGATFVPDVRWFGWRQWRSDAIRQLLDSPPRWLSGAVRSLTDGSVSLAAEAISASDSVPDVKLSSEVMRLSESDRALLVRQIRLTLSDGDEDAPLIITEDSGSDLSSADEAVSLRMESTPRGTYALSSEAVISIELPNLLRVGVVPEGEDLIDFVFAPWGGAVIRGDGSVECLNDDASSCGVILDGAKADVLSTGAENEVWAARDGSIDVWNHADGSVETLDASWLVGRRVLDMVVAPEGDRLALAVQDSSGDELIMASIKRDDRNRPTGLSESVLALAYGGRYGMDVTRSGHSMVFFDPVTMVFAFLGTDETPSVRRMPVSGLQDEQNVPNDLSALASGMVGSSNGLFTLDSLGVVRSMTGSLTTSWRLAASQIEGVYGR